MNLIEIMRANGLLNSQNELMLYGIIGDWYEGLDAATIVREIEALDTPEITVRIYSKGGNVLDGIAMFNALKNAGKPVHVIVDGVCASIATVVAMAASEGHLYTPDNALWMIHGPWLDGMSGNSSKLRESADNLDVVAESMIAAYVGSGRFTEERIREIIDTGKDYYFTGAEAVEQGIADQLTDTVKVAASMDMTGLNAPQGQHKELYDFYAVNAAQTHHSKPEEKTMDPLKKLLAAIAALTEQGIAEGTINASLATAFAVKEADVQALLKEDGDATEDQLTKALDAVNNIQPKQPEPQGRQQSAPTGDEPVDIAAALAAERSRNSAIDSLAKTHGLPDELRDTMKNDGSTIEQARAQALGYLEKADRNNQPAPGVRVVDTMGEAFRMAGANAMLHRMQPGNYQLEEGGRDFRGMSLLDFASACLQREGVRVTGLTKNELAAQAMHSTSDFPAIVADVANQLLVRAYTAQTRTFVPFAEQVTLTDFKAHHNVEIGGGSELLEVKENGEFEQGTVSEGDMSYSLMTWGRIFNFGRQLLINDNIGAFNRFMTSVGALAARKENSIVWGLVKAGAIFSTDNGNLVTSGGAPSETQLNKNRKLFRKMKGLDNEPLNIVAKYMAVGTDHETASQKMLTAVLASTTGEVNTYANTMELIVEPLLDDVTNNPWYTFADPMAAPTIEYAYLEGQTGPYIETKNGFEVDGIQMKIRHDFNAGWAGKKGVVKNPGA